MKKLAESKYNPEPVTDIYGFSVVARDIVQRVRNEMLAKGSDDVKKGIQKRPAKDIERIAQKLTEAFYQQQQGFKGLAQLAHREIAILGIRAVTAKYSIKRMNGILGPLEYFDRAYKAKFSEFGLPVNALGQVDPNLHTSLRKGRLFPLVTASLKSG